MFTNVTTHNIDVSFLLDVAKKKFVLGHKTMELMAEARSEEQRFAVALVVLMEVEESLRFCGMSEQEVGFIQKYHRSIQTFLDRLRGEQLSSNAAIGQGFALGPPSLGTA